MEGDVLIIERGHRRLTATAVTAPSRDVMVLPPAVGVLGANVPTGQSGTYRRR